MAEIRESIKKQAEVLRLSGMGLMSIISIDLLNAAQTFKNLNEFDVIINLACHTVCFLSGRLMLSESFKLLEQEENQNECK
jgi:hypothetical protein